MPLTLLIVIAALLMAVLVLQILLLTRKARVDLSAVERACAAVGTAQERTERAVREEIAKSRDESVVAARHAREEASNALRQFGDSLVQQVSNLTQSNDAKLERVRETVEQRLQVIQDENAKRTEQVRHDTAANSKAQGEETVLALKGFNETLVASVGQMATAQQGQLENFGGRLDKLTQTNEEKLASVKEAVEQRLAALQEDNGKRLDRMRDESATSAQKAREEVTTSLKGFTESVVKTVSDMASGQRTQLGNVVEQVSKLTDVTEKRLDAQRASVDERLRQIQEDGGKKLDQTRTETTASAKQMREEVAASLKGFNDSVLKGMGAMGEVQKAQMEAFSGQLAKLTESNERKMEEMRVTVEGKLRNIQEDNAKQLDQMRATVDEKLQGTLERRLGESFKVVGERLEQVYKGLGEMQTLASGVGDLKRVLTNVKARGTWGEVQLAALLEEVLLPDQYATNVSTKDNGERVEFAVKMPGRSGDPDEVVWLPIDAKFPVEDYQRLVEAQEQADPEAAEAAAKALEARIKACASDICDKYIAPPFTTDFGILFLPTEGLFAEVVRRIGLTEYVQRECRVTIAGPTTLWSILNSLRMGFRTLAIQQRSSEVWGVLGAVKTEFAKYGDVLAKVQKKLNEASDTIETEVGRRTRAIQRKLKSVQELPAGEAQAVLLLEGGDGEPEVDLA